MSSAEKYAKFITIQNKLNSSLLRSTPELVEIAEIIPFTGKWNERGQGTASKPTASSTTRPAPVKAKAPKFTKKHYIEIANTIKNSPKKQRSSMIKNFIKTFSSDNSRFDSKRFTDASKGDLDESVWRHVGGATGAVGGIAGSAIGGKVGFESGEFLGLLKDRKNAYKKHFAEHKRLGGYEKERKRIGPNGINLSEIHMGKIAKVGVIGGSAAAGYSFGAAAGLAKATAAGLSIGKSGAIGLGLAGPAGALAAGGLAAYLLRKRKQKMEEGFVTNSTLAGAAAGAVGGAATGVTLGSPAGVPGVLIGGAVGGVAGALGGAASGAGIGWIARHKIRQGIETKELNTKHELSGLIDKHGVNITHGKHGIYYVQGGPLKSGHHIAFTANHKDLEHGTEPSYHWKHIAHEQETVNAAGDKRNIVVNNFNHQNPDMHSSVKNMDGYLEGLHDANQKEAEKTLSPIIKKAKKTRAKKVKVDMPMTEEINKYAKFITLQTNLNSSLLRSN